MNAKQKAVVGGAVTAAVVGALVWLVPRHLGVTGAAEKPPEFEVIVESSVPDAVAYLNSKRVQLKQVGTDKWRGKRDDINAIDAVERAVHLNGLTNTGYKLEIKYKGQSIDKEEGVTNKAAFRTPATGTKRIHLPKLVAVPNDT